MTTSYVSEPLNKEEAIDFISLFLEIESSNGTEIKIVPTTDNLTIRGWTVTINVINGNDFWGKVLKASFKDGLLQHNGWNEKFMKK